MRFIKYSFLFFLLFILYNKTHAAANYYVDFTGGNDSNSGLSTGLAWKTITKINGFSFSTNDTINFKRNEEWSGIQLLCPANFLYFRAYGTGVNPKISGFETLTSWTNAGGGVWNKTITSSTLDTTLNVVVIDNNIAQIGRWPNRDSSGLGDGYLLNTATNVATPSITGPSLAYNWSGSKVAIRKNHWIIDKCIVVSQSGGTVVFQNPPDGGSDLKVGYGYFFYDNITTLDRFGEYFLNKTTKNLSMFFGGLNPSSFTIKASVVDTVINFGGHYNITWDSIDVEGANMIAIFDRFGANMIVKNSNISNSYNGIIMKGISTLLGSSNNNLRNILNVGEYINPAVGAVSYVTNDTLYNIGSIPGMSGNGDGQAIGINVVGDYCTILNSRFDSCGYIPIALLGSNITVNQSSFDQCNYTKDDGGAIYTSTPGRTNIKITNNVISNSNGALYGSPNYLVPHTTNDAMGIYLDLGAENTYVYGNSVSNCPNGAGIYMHFAGYDTIRANTFYNVYYGAGYLRLPPNTTPMISNIIYTSNISYATKNNVYSFNGAVDTASITLQQSVEDMFTRSDSNFYRTAISNLFNVSANYIPAGNANINMDLSGWRSYTLQDANSTTIPISTPYYYDNPTNAAITVNFAGQIYTDVYGNLYSGSVIIPAFQSKVLFYVGPINPPVSGGTYKSLTKFY